MREQELKPCPFCGNTAGTLKEANGQEFGRCRPCGIDYMPADDWNRRAAPPLLADEQMPPLPEPVVVNLWGVATGYTDQLRAHGRAAEAAVRKQILEES